MVNPVLVEKKGSRLTVTDDIKRLFQLTYHEQNENEESNENTAKIKVSDLISKMAFYYEKIRNAVDYEEEHLLRKNAIERVLKRQILIEGALAIKELRSVEIAKHLLVELIRAGYLPNNKIPEVKIREIGAIVDRYLTLRKEIAKLHKTNKEVSEVVKWTIAIAASEIEENLGRKKSTLASVDYMFKILNEKVKLPEGSEYDKDKEIQIYIGIYRNLLKFDKEMLGHILMKYYISDWHEANSDRILEIAKDIFKIKGAIEAQIDHPLVGQINRIIKRYTIFFTVLSDIIEEDPVNSYETARQNPNAFTAKVKKACEKRYKQIKAKLWRSAVRSIIYIFITKSVFAVIIEVPATQWFGEELNALSLIINVSFPAVLLFLIILFTKLPGDDNTSRIIEGINELVYKEKEHKDSFILRKPVKRGPALSFVFGLIFSITFFVSFGAVIWGLDQIGFSWVSIIIFLFFLAFVSFFSSRIRKTAHELQLAEPKENIFGFLSDVFYIPIVSAGKWMSEKFDKVNVFVFILDFIIEAPFKIFVEIAEEWTKYVKERKDEIV